MVDNIKRMVELRKELHLLEIEQAKSESVTVGELIDMLQTLPKDTPIVDILDDSLSPINDLQGLRLLYSPDTKALYQMSMDNPVLAASIASVPLYWLAPLKDIEHSHKSRGFD